MLDLNISHEKLNKELVDTSDIFFIEEDELFGKTKGREEVFYENPEDYFSKQTEVLKEHFINHLDNYPVIETYRVTKILNYYLSEFEFKVVMFLGYIDNGETGAFGFLMLPDSYSDKLRTRKIKSAVKELIKKTGTQDD
jgi:hypothetical protein